MRRLGGLLLPLLLLIGSATAPSARTLRYLPAQTIEVCKSSACAYTTIGSALASISDAANSKRYIIHVSPGDYLEALSVSAAHGSYITIDGGGRDTTRIACTTGAGCDTVTIDRDVTEFSLSNIWIAGSQPIKYNGVATPAASTIYITDCNIGTNDTSIQDTSRDGILTVFSGAPRTTYSRHNIYRSNFDTVRLSDGDIFDSAGDRFEIIGASSVAVSLRTISFITGGQAFIRDFYAETTDSGSSNSGLVAFVHLAGSGTVTYQPRFILSDGYIRITASDGTHGNSRRCVYLVSAGQFATPTFVRMMNVSCEIATVSGVGTNSAFEVDSGNNFGNWDARWIGGKFNVSGGASNFDVDQANTATNGACTGSGTPFSCCSGAGAGTCAFIAAVSGVERSGTITGAGTVTIGDTYKAAFAGGVTAGTGAFSTRPLTIPTADLAVGACTVNEESFDTGGATKEFCVCGTANTWGCWNLATGAFNANGPAD